MQKSDSNQTAMSSHRRVKSSTTLNRKYVKRPAKNSDVTVAVKRSPKVRRFNVPIETGENTASRSAEQAMAQAEVHPIQTAANAKMKKRSEATPPEKKMTAKELKDRAIQKALSTASKPAAQKSAKNKKSAKLHFGFGRVILALSCAAAAVFAIAYFVNLNMPDISLKVAAMQTGIEASYPTYVPREYSLSDITSENGKITLNFKNSSDNSSFSLVEENSSWDSNALLTNYIKDAYGENYSTIREQGLTIYIGNDGAAWVNGGVVYKLNTNGANLTKKQIRSIATSL